jgi:hypothetical protein
VLYEVFWASPVQVKNAGGTNTTDAIINLSLYATQLLAQNKKEPSRQIFTSAKWRYASLVPPNDHRIQHRVFDSAFYNWRCWTASQLVEVSTLVQPSPFHHKTLQLSLSLHHDTLQLASAFSMTSAKPWASSVHQHDMSLQSWSCLSLRLKT